MYNVEEIEKCQSDVQHLEKQMDIHFEYIDKIAEAESKRIDAIRAVDTGAVTLASEKAATQTAVLESQVIASSEALRNLITSTNIAAAQQLSQVTTQLTDRIALLERSHYEIKGRSGISVPLLMLISGFTGGVIVFIVQKLISL